MRVALGGVRPVVVRPTVGWLAVVWLAAASACDVPGAPPETALHPDDLPVLTLHEDLRLGSLDDDREGFSQIVGIEVDDAGRLYVLEGVAGVPEVRIYAPDGTLLRRVGGQGDGPGEFARPAEMGLLGDTLWVRDAVHGRITFFAAADGTLLRTVPTPQVAVESGDPSVRASVVGARPLPGGGFQGRPEIFFMGPLEVDSVSFPRIRFHPEGGGGDTVGWQRLPAGAHQILFEGIPILVSPPLADPPIRIPLDEAVPEEPTDTLVVERRAAAAADDGLLRVVLLPRDGSPADTVLRLRYRPLPVPANFADSLARARAATYAPLGLDTVAARRVVRDALDVGAFHPPVRAHRRGADGAVWLDLVYAGESGGSGGSGGSGAIGAADNAWLVLEPDGTVRGLVGVEPGVRILWSDREWAWALEPDALEVPWLVRYRIDGSEEAAAGGPAASAVPASRAAPAAPAAPAPP